MLMRLSRGSGAGGLAAPRPVQQAGGGIVRMRPLLTIGRADLRAALKKVGAVWHEDASNKTDDHFRNRVRRKVVPRLEQASPQNVFVGFAASRTQLQEDDDALESWVTERVGQPESGQPFDLSSLVSQSGALVRRAVQRWLLAEDLARFLSRAAVTEVIEAVRRSEAQQISAGNGQFIRTKNGCLWVERGIDSDGPDRNWKSVLLRAGETVVGPAGDRLDAKKIRLTPALRKRILAGEWSPATIVHLDPGADWNGSFVVRSWAKGDRYRPLGAPGRSTLQNLFVNRKIPKEQRKCLPVICKDDSSPLWVPGLPPSEDVSLQLTSKLVVQLTYAAPRAKLNRLTPQLSRNA
jgi:tRNA(Ile)-lysidine synthase